MKLQTQQIVTTLTEITNDLYYSLVGDEPYVTVFWEVEEKGEFSVENFLLDNCALTSLEPEDFLHQIQQTQSQPVVEHYQNLLTLLQANLSELTIYSYGFPELPEDLFNGDLPIDTSELAPLLIPLFIGLSPAGEWIGLAPQQKLGYQSSPRFVIPDLESVGETTTALVEQIKSLTSQIDHKLSTKQWKLKNAWEVVLTASRTSITEKLLSQAGFLSIEEINEFLDSIESELEECEEEEELPADLQQKIELREYFQSQLLYSRAYNLDYNISDESFTIHYALGQTEDGDWMGVVTDSFTF
ncbi:MAG: hypothetical protein F6K31_20505 [Symploca sp. SIO2G7]|nr:hypothetical protein [Symploca sp. SIO2G7]